MESIRLCLAVSVVVCATASSPAGASAQTVTYSTLVSSSDANNDGTGPSATFGRADAVGFDAGGNLIVFDVVFREFGPAAHRVRRITPAAVVTTLPQITGSGLHVAGFPRDSAGNVYFVALSPAITIQIMRVDPTGTTTTFYPVSGAASAIVNSSPVMTFDSAGILYVADPFGVWKIAPDATATRFAGGSLTPFGVPPKDGPVGVATFDLPVGLVVDGAGNTYVSTTSHLIRKIAPDGTTTTIAGAYNTPGSADGVAANARFHFPTSLAVDSSGNLYIADSGSHTIRRLSADGVVTTIAGTVGVPGETQGQDGPALSASFAGPYGLAVASNGDIYIGDGPAVRKLSGGVVSTLAGTLTLQSAPTSVALSDMSAPRGVAFGGTHVYVTDAGTHTLRAFNRAKSTFASFSVIGGTKNTAGSADGPLTDTATFTSLRDVAFDGAGAAYVIDDNTIRKVVSDVVTTVAGKPGGGRSFDATGRLARFRSPTGLAIDGSGIIYVVDDCRIRRVTATGVVTTLAGAECGTADGTGAAARFFGPKDLTLDVSGNLYVADVSTIRKVTPAGVVTTIAGQPGASGGTVDGTGSAARFLAATGIAIDASGDLYVADSQTLRKVTPAGVVTTIAGSGTASGTADGTGSAARFNELSRVAVAPNGTVYGLQSSGLRAITPAGVVTTVVNLNFALGIGIDAAGTVYVAGPFGGSGPGSPPGYGISTVATDGTMTAWLRHRVPFVEIGGSADGHIVARALFNAPSGLALSATGSMAIADTGNHTIRVLQSNVVSTLAGSAGASGNVDATGGSARFNAPQGVAFDGAGDLYVADTGNNAIRKVTAAGVVSTVVSGLNAPKGVAVDAAGTIYIADSGSHTIRTYPAGGPLTTLAGSAGTSGSSDGTGSAAQFSSPAGLAIAPDGTIYVTDTGNHTIRAVTAAGVVTTVGGSAGAFGRTDGVGPAARFRGPEAVAVDSAGSLYLADTQTGSLRLGIAGTATAPVITASPLSRSAAVHETVQFSCAATGNPLPAYRWERSLNSGSFFDVPDGYRFSGVNTPTLTITDVGVSDNGVRYRCRALTSFASVVSDSASLSIPVLTVTPARLAFGAVASPGGGLASVTQPQTVSIGWQGSGAPGWSATASPSWAQITGGSGTGAGVFTVAAADPGTQSSTSFATITITASDPEFDLMIPVSVVVHASDAPPLGVVDTPANHATGQSGSIAVTGWAVDDIDTDHVEIWRDAVAGETTPVFTGAGPGNGKIFISNATFVPGARPDVESTYGNGRPGARNAGWGYMLLTQGLWNQGNGTYTLYAFAFDKAGNFSALGSKTITVDNANATKPFGAIDTPGQGESASGIVQNFGWALTPGSSCSIANPSVRVSIDSGPLTPVVYGDARPDIAGAFPSYTNSAAAGGHYTLDTTTLANGLHTIGWFVTDNCGRADGMGSRFFTVANSSLVAAPSPVGPTLRSGVRPVLPRVVRIAQNERIEVPLPGDEPYRAGPLPIGSSFDAATNTFMWQPAAGFLGAYDLQFLPPEGGSHMNSVGGSHMNSVGSHMSSVGGSHNSPVNLRVVVGPPVRMVIDTPHAGNVLQSSGFTVAGWAVDLGSIDGAGIDTLHVWAYPVGGPSTGSEQAPPVFVGVAKSGGARSDVAKLYGVSFGDAGFTLTGTLAPGTYDLVVFAHSAAMDTFAGAETVRVVVR